MATIEDRLDASSYAELLGRIHASLAQNAVSEAERSETETALMASDELA